MTSFYWPGTRIVKSQDNAFTDWMTQPRSTFRGHKDYRAGTNGKTHSQHASDNATRARAILAERHSGTYARAGGV